MAAPKQQVQDVPHDLVEIQQIGAELRDLFLSQLYKRQVRVLPWYSYKCKVLRTWYLVPGTVHYNLLLPVQ